MLTDDTSDTCDPRDQDADDSPKNRPDHAKHRDDISDTYTEEHEKLMAEYKAGVPNET